jgi:prepilin-type N-terminal cleavage/methylation domain-containing protein
VCTLIEATVMRPTRATPSPGFTLLELMIAVAILALLAALATPSLADFFERNRVRAAGDDLVSLISQARAEAVKNDLDVNVALTGSGTAWCAGANAAAAPTGGNEAGNATACDCTQTTQCMVAGRRQVLQSPDFGGVSIGTLPAPFTFDSTLGAIVPLPTSDIDVTLTSPNGKYDLVVRVNALGQANTCTPSAKPDISGIRECE